MAGSENTPPNPALIMAQQAAYIRALEQQVAGMAVQLVQLGCERDANSEALAAANAALSAAAAAKKTT